MTTTKNSTAPEHTVRSVEHEGFFYITANGHFYKGCSRCGGTGHYSFNGYDSICYKCRNVQEWRLGEEFPTQDAAEKWCHQRAVRRAQRLAKAEKERLAKLAKRQAAWDALAASHPAIWEMLSKAANLSQTLNGEEPTYTERNTFVWTMSEQLWHMDEWSYSEKMLTALQTIADKRSEEAREASNATLAPTGRVAITGEIISAKAQEGDFGTAWKIVVKDDRGFRVYVSLPKAQTEELFDEFYTWAEDNGHHTLHDFGPYCWLLGADSWSGAKGRRITMTATLEPSSDDPSFAFGSRPAKGSWL